MFLFQEMYGKLSDNIKSHVDILTAKIEQLNKQDQAVPETDTAGNIFCN